MNWFESWPGRLAPGYVTKTSFLNHRRVRLKPFWLKSHFHSFCRKYFSVLLYAWNCFVLVHRSCFVCFLLPCGEKDEFSRNDLRQSHAAIQELTSQAKELQESMKDMNDSTRFQEKESICCAIVSHVPRHPAVVLSLRAMSSRDQSLRSDTLNLSGTQGKFFGHPRAVTDSSQTFYQGILHSTNQSATGGNTVQKGTGRLVARGEEQIGSTMPLPNFARRPLNMNSFLPAEISQNSVAVRLQILELHFGKFTTFSTFSCWMIRFKTQFSACSGFLSEAMLWIKEVEMVESVGDLKSSRSIQGFLSSKNFEMLDVRIASALSKIIHNTRFKKQVSLEEQKAEKEDRFFFFTDLFHDLRLLSSHWCSWYRIGLRCWGIGHACSSGFACECW